MLDEGFDFALPERAGLPSGYRGASFDVGVEG
jgi:hypothetical protein